MLVLKAKHIEGQGEFVIASPALLESGKISFELPVKIKAGDHSVVVFAQAIENIVPPDHIGISPELMEKLRLTDGAPVTILQRRPPPSYDLVKKKAFGGKWEKSDIYTIVNDISKREYTDYELEMFVLAQFFKGLGSDELEYLTRAIAESGIRLSFDEPAYDKHSIGGIPGNKVTLLIVPIVAAAGLLIPKTSSRAITSPAGTADTMEVLAPVEFSKEEIEEMAPKARGMIIWGGSLDLAPVDDILIKHVKRHIGVDPKDQMMAAIIAKKLALGIDRLVIDLPTGRGAKLTTEKEAMEFGHDVVNLCRRVAIHAEAVITHGEQPLGHAVGPAIEAREALNTLMGKGSSSVLEKSAEIAGILLEMGNVAPPGKGYELAKEYVSSGKALKKFKEIIEFQGGNPDITPDEIPLGPYRATYLAHRNGYISRIDNRIISLAAKAAGAPESKGAGLWIHSKMGDFVKQGDVAITIYSDSEHKLSQALNILETYPPFSAEGSVIYRISGLRGETQPSNVIPFEEPI